MLLEEGRLVVKPDQRLKELAEVPLFAECSAGELEEISKLVDLVVLPKGSVLMREGTIGHEVFVIAEGEAVVTMHGHRLAILGSGEVVGEMAVIEAEPRVATVTARTTLRAYVLTSVAFATMLDHCPTVGRNVLAAVAHRLREYQAA
jgi:CRP/FNR family cyclic AMP-dependent transcriptional regulator